MEGTTIETGGIGRPVRRKEDLRLVTGAGRYTTDVAIPGQAHMVVVRSPHAHAHIKGILTSAAETSPGVLLVLTAVDLAADGINELPSYSNIPGIVDLDLQNSDGSEKKATPHALFASERVRYVGDPVAAVVAETQAAALDAAEKIVVDYEPLPSVTATPTLAGGDVPQLWPHIPRNICLDGGFGDTDATQAAIDGAAHVVSLKTWIQRATGVMLETRAASCDYDTEADRLTIFCGCDNSVRFKRDVAAALGIGEERIRAVAGDVGGNYGTRNWTYPEYAIVAWAAMRLKRPVRWQASRSEAFLSDYHGRDCYADATLALDADGRFLALKADIVSNVGAYTIAFVPLTKTTELLPSVYDFPTARVRGVAALSNTSPTAPYRSAGRPEAMFITERLIDIAACQCGFDPIELRRRNIVGADRMPYRTALGLEYDSGDFPTAMARALEMGDWEGFPARREAAQARGRLRGIGFANYIEITSGFPMERTEITVRPEGRVDVVIGTTSSGQGHETSFAQCVSDWLGVPFEAIRLLTGDTDVVKDGGGSHSARSMRMAGIVMGKASDQIVERGKRIAAQMLEAAPGDIAFTAGRFEISGTDRSVGIFEVAAAAERGDGLLEELPADLRGPLGAECQEVMQHPGYPYGAQVCEVEIDPDTGAVEVVRYSAVDDVGRAINPMILHGQTHGGIAQGAGQALMENAHYDAGDGQLLAGSLLDYALPRAGDFPSFDTGLMEVPTPTNALGVRGGGEGGATPALAVVVNAIVDALSDYGVTHIEMPATPERVWRAMNGGN